MVPVYTSSLFSVTENDLAAIPWVARTNARLECFMSPVPRDYTYGSGRGIRTYSSIPMLPWVAEIMRQLGGEPNVCFLNRYITERHALGWHADDSPDTSGEHPISVVSFGESREIWWRPIGFKGVIPEEFKQELDHGSLFVMPAGFQSAFEHRIPKGARQMTQRVSLTFRHMK